MEFNAENIAKLRNKGLEENELADTFQIDREAYSKQEKEMLLNAIKEIGIESRYYQNRPSDLYKKFAIISVYLRIYCKQIKGMEIVRKNELDGICD